MFQCPHCNGEVESNPQLAGQEVNCPHCNGLVTMPGNPFDFVKDRVSSAARSASSVASRQIKKHNINPILLVGGGVAAFLLLSSCMCCGVVGLFNGGEDDRAVSGTNDDVQPEEKRLFERMTGVWRDKAGEEVRVSLVGPNKYIRGNKYDLRIEVISTLLDQDTVGIRATLGSGNVFMAALRLKWTKRGGNIIQSLRMQMGEGDDDYVDFEFVRPL